jgi:hypothetical protein
MTTVRTVIVTVDPPVAPSVKPVIVVNPELLNLDGVTGAVVIQFQLQTEGFTFPVSPPAIKVQNNTGGQFGTVTLSNYRKTATLSDDNSDGTTYSYTVSVVTTSSEVHYRVDPIIKNRGQ